MRLELDNIVQAYRKREVLQGISFQIEQGESAACWVRVAAAKPRFSDASPVLNR